MGIRDLAVSRGSTVHFFRHSQLHIKPGLNARDLSTEDNVAHIEWLAEQIEAKGFTSIVYIYMDDGKPTISQGHCRMAAVDLLIKRGKWNEAEMLIPVLAEAKGIGELEILAGMFTTNGSKQLSPREAAANILKIMARVGQDEAKTAALIGRSRSYVHQMLEFNAQASPEIHEAIARKEISQSQAATILRKEGSRKGAETIKQAVEKAKASGKKKATAKHIPSAPPTVPEPRLPLEYSREAVQLAAIVLARDFLDRAAYNFNDTQTCKEAQRIVDELDCVLGKRELQAAE